MHETTGVVETAGGHQTVDMRMNTQRSSPGMQHADDSRSGTQILRVCQQLLQSFPCSRHQQVGKPRSVVSPPHVQRLRDGEHYMHVVTRHQLLSSLLQPPRPDTTTALRATPVTARLKQSHRTRNVLCTHQERWSGS
jgi:hypothetical protein